MRAQGRDTGVVESLAKWAADEYKDKRGETVDTSSWPRRYLTVRFKDKWHTKYRDNASATARAPSLALVVSQEK